MNTTNLFVELVVIGIGVLMWIAIFVVALAGYAWFPTDDTFLLIAALPSLAIVYVLGIVWDRLADFIFDRMWTNVLKAEHYSTVGHYYDDRRIILTQSKPLSDLLEYGRSRLRICRGWSLNALAIAFSSTLFVLLRPEAEVPAAVGTTCVVACLLLSVGCWLAWQSLSKAEYRKIREQSEFLERVREREVATEVS